MEITKYFLQKVPEFISKYFHYLTIVATAILYTIRSVALRFTVIYYQTT